MNFPTRVGNLKASTVVHGAVCVPGEERYQPVVHNCRQIQFRHLGEQTGVADSVERLRKIQRHRVSTALCRRRGSSHLYRTI